MCSKRTCLTKIVLVLLLLLHFNLTISANEKSLSTSIISMIKLLEIETELVDSVENYAAKLQMKVDDLKNLVKELRAEHNKSTSKEEYVFNPLNGFALIRRLYNDWPEIELFMSEPVALENSSMLAKYRSEMPTATDLAEASDAMYRLQTVYDLQVEDLVRGIINGRQYDAKLKSIDCYFMGYHLFVKNLYYPAGTWLNVSITNFEQDNQFNKIVDFGKEQPLKLYAETLVLQRCFKLYTHLWSRKNKIEFLANTYDGPPLERWEPLLSNYELGCRGHFVNETSKMFCLYNTTTTPFLRLAPIKMEIISLEPYIVIFHDVMSDKEIEHIKTIARPRLIRAQIYDLKLKDAMVNEERTSQFSYFDNDEDEVAKRINKRIVDMTGFDISDSEVLQVGNYGMAGHYGIHFDFFNVAADTKIVMKEGDRISTVLFYLSDVEQGGGTVFPGLKITVFPRKGSALMWYNLNNRLEPDEQTLHGACPVLVGSKWVCSKWIRAHAQIFKKPCYK